MHHDGAARSRGLFGVQTTPVSFSLPGFASRRVATDAPCKLDFLGEDGDALGVDGAEVPSLYNV
jgi:hypothetical protein